MSRPCASYSFFFEILPSVIACRTNAGRAHLDFMGVRLRAAPSRRRSPRCANSRKSRKTWTRWAARSRMSASRRVWNACSA